MAAPGYVIEDDPEGRTLVVTGRWTAEAAAAVQQEDIDGVWLNYARGYSAPDLSFLDAWPIKRLLVLDRSLTDLAPLSRLGATLERLSFQAAPGATVDLAELPRLRHLAAGWDEICDTLYAPTFLQRLVVLDYREIDLRPLTVQPSLQEITLKGAPKLETLDGIAGLPTLTRLTIQAARELHVYEVEAVAATLRRFELEACLDIDDLAPLSALTDLRFIGINDCGRISSLHPIGTLARLEYLHAWGSTRIADGDLSPLLRLSQLNEIRMRERREYQPSLAEVKATLGCT